MANASVQNRVKETPTQKTPQQTEAPPQKHMPHVFSPEGVLLLSWALMLDILGLLSNLVFPIVASFIVDIIGMGTIGLYMFLKTKKMPHTKKWNRFAKRFGLASFSELIPLWGDLVTSWTIYLFLEMDK